MAIKGLRPSVLIPHVLKRDPARGPNGEALEGATVFLLKTLNGNERAIVRDSIMQIDGMSFDENGKPNAQVSMSANKAAYEACRFGITGWSNFTDDDDKLIPYEAEEEMIGRSRVLVAKRECVARIDVNDANEIMGVVMGLSTLSRADEKKSDAASSQKNSSQNENAPAVADSSNGDAKDAA